MYKDIISGVKIPGIYALMNGKNETFYRYVLKSIINILTQNNQYILEYETIVTDSEEALIKIIKELFPKTQHIICLLHYKSDLFRNIKSYCLYKKIFK